VTVWRSGPLDTRGHLDTSWPQFGHITVISRNCLDLFAQLARRQIG
jgi:hypothetical protein